MSKGNFLLGTVAGKLGDMVFFRAKGTQRTRTYIKKMADAQTRAQGAMRTQLQNLVSFYRSAKRLLDHSFTDRTPIQSSYNAFVSANLNKTRVYLPKNMAQKGAAIVAPYKVSSGSLPPIIVSGVGDDAVTNLAIGTLAISDTLTIADLSVALLDNNQSLQQGDQLSYVSVKQLTDVTTSVPVMEVGYYEITLDTTNTELVSAYMPTQAIANKNGFIGHGSHVADGGFCWVISRRDENGKLIASPQFLILNSYTVYNLYCNDSAEEVATRSYSDNNDLFLDPGDNSEAGISNVPSVSALSVAGTTLTAGAGSVSVASGSVSIAINGGNLADVEAVVIKINGTSYTMNISTKGATLITGTITVGSAVTAENFIVMLDGVSAYGWTATSGGGDSSDSGDPFDPYGT